MKEYRTAEQKRKFYNSAVWMGKQGLRQQALKRDRYECQMCKREGKIHLDSTKVDGERKTIELNVHHIKEVERYPELALTLDNTITICIRHHNLIHDRYQPKNVKLRDERW